MSTESVAHLNVVAQKSWRRQVSCFRFAGAFHDEGMTAFPGVKNEEGGEGGEEKGEEGEQLHQFEHSDPFESAVGVQKATYVI